VNPFALGFTNTVLTGSEVDATTHDGPAYHGRGVDVSEVCRGRYVADRTYLIDVEMSERMLAGATPPAVAGVPAAPSAQVHSRAARAIIRGRPAGRRTRTGGARTGGRHIPRRPGPGPPRRPVARRFA
jgi:hypothetical protein